MTLSKNALIGDIEEELSSQGRVVVRGFGVFELKKRKGHKARNPATGEAIDVPEHNRVSFRPSTVLKDKFR